MSALQIAVGMIVMLVVLGLYAVLSTIPPKRTADARGCVISESTPMGTRLGGSPSRSHLAWNDSCPSGIGWSTKAP